MILMESAERTEQYPCHASCGTRKWKWQLSIGWFSFRLDQLVMMHSEKPDPKWVPSHAMFQIWVNWFWWKWGHDVIFYDCHWHTFHLGPVKVNWTD